MTILRSLSGAMLAATLVTGPVFAQETTFFRIGTGGAGGTYFPIGGTIANGISNPPDRALATKAASVVCPV